MRRYAVMLLLLVLVGCGTTATPDGPRFEATRFAVPEAVTTCGDVIRAALDTLTCAPEMNGICAISAEYVPDDPGANLIGSGAIGQVGAVTTLVNAPTAGDLTTWWAYVLRALPETPVTLITTSATQLENLTPALDALSLQTNASACADAPAPALMIQARPETQVNLTINGAQVTVGTTAAITASRNDVMTVYPLEGLSVVSSGEVTRVVRQGEQITVALDGLTATGEPDPATRTSSGVIDRLPLGLLPRPINPATEANTRSQTQAGQVLQEGVCTPNPDWTGQHTVQRGESLARIAPVYGLTFQELQAGNCIQNPARINPGLVLRVPLDATPTPSPAPLPTQPAQQGPGGVLLPPNATVVIVPAFSQGASPITTDAAAPIAAGSCTTVRWNVTEATQILLDGQPVPAQGTRQVCPQVTTVYELRVTTSNGNQQTFTSAVFVRGN